MPAVDVPTIYVCIYIVSTSSSYIYRVERVGSVGSVEIAALIFICRLNQEAASG